MSIPKTMKAYTVRRNLLWPFQALLSSGYANQPEFVDRPVPTPADDELLVKVETFAANPTDTLHLDYVGASGSIIGCDFVGTVVSAGPRTSRHKVGDKVCGVVHGGKFPAIGSAAEYCVIGDDVAMSVPEGWSNEDAATLGVPFLTAAAILYDSQGVPQPPAKVDGEPWYLVSGGATSVGLFVIQLARLAGFKVVASCSPKSFDLVKSYGADLVVSYHNTEAALSQIKEATDGGPGVKFGADCVGGKPNVRFAVDAFGPEGGLLTSIVPGGKAHRADVKIEQVLLYTYLGKAFSFVPLILTFPSEPEKRLFLADWVAKSPSVIKQYGIKPNPVDVSKGWETLPAGWDKLRKKQVSGKKLIFDLK